MSLEVGSFSHRERLVIEEAVSRIENTSLFFADIDRQLLDAHNCLGGAVASTDGYSVSSGGDLDDCRPPPPPSVVCSVHTNDRPGEELQKPTVHPVRPRHNHNGSTHVTSLRNTYLDTDPDDSLRNGSSRPAMSTPRSGELTPSRMTPPSKR